MEGDSFAALVYSACKKIPKGKVSTYKAIGDYLDSKGYRAVGNALNKNPFAPIVPCHRVVKSDGRIGGFAGGVEKKVKLLEKEKVLVADGKILDFKKYLYTFE
jgi:methylated-DNA-[protein]-cysteine S-methyltransferase